jgi:hypothetical protein
VPLYLELVAEGPYGIELLAPGWAARDDPLAPAVEIALELEDGHVAACWPQGQSVKATIRLVNAGARDLDLRLDTATSHYAWQLRPEMTDVTLPAGATIAVPADVVIQPDAWTDAPVLLSVAATAPDGGRQSESAVIEAVRDVAPGPMNIADAGGTLNGPTPGPGARTSARARGRGRGRAP